MNPRGERENRKAALPALRGCLRRGCSHWNARVVLINYEVDSASLRSLSASLVPFVASSLEFALGARAWMDLPRLSLLDPVCVTVRHCAPVGAWPVISAFMQAKGIFRLWLT